MNDFDDDIRKRQQALSVLEDDDAATVNEDVVDTYDAAAKLADETVFGADDLEKADHIARTMHEGRSGLASKVALRDAKWKELASIAPFARISPPSVLKGITGNNARVTSGGPALQVANWGGDDSEALPVTVTFGGINSAPAIAIPFPGIQAFRPFGIVKFGTKGMLVTAEVDICQGCQFVVGASMVTLQVALEDDGSGNKPVSEPLSGMLSFYPVIRTKPITRTKYVDGLADTVLIGFPVPAFARDVIFYRKGTGAFTLTFIDSNGTTVYDFAVAGGTVMLEPIQLSSDVQAVLVTNHTGGGTAMTGRMVFGLSF